MEQLAIRGTVKIYNEDKTKLYKTYKNAYLNAGKSAFMAFLKGGTFIEGYKYLAIGTGESPTDPDQPTLENEVFRKELSNVSVVDNKLICDCLIESEEGNTDPWTELGLIVGGTSAQLNSGVLFNRVGNIYEIKKNTNAITVSWEIEVISS